VFQELLLTQKQQRLKTMSPAGHYHAILKACNGSTSSGAGGALIAFTLSDASRLAASRI
jgi:hypothetical protein